MQSRIVPIAIASTFLAGVAGRFVALYWTFSDYYWFSIAFDSALAITLAVLVIRGDVFYRWFAVAISAGLAYRSFAMFVYLNSKGTPGGAYLFPGVAFSVCSLALFALLLTSRLTSHQQDQGTIK